MQKKLITCCKTNTHNIANNGLDNFLLYICNVFELSQKSNGSETKISSWALRKWKFSHHHGQK